jgi:oligopeptide/dipeptide ABC transporter ATP-binding protein
MKPAILEVQDLSVHFHTENGLLKAVDHVSFHVAAGETLGLVGESGCGKSVSALSILRLVPSPGRIESGRVLWQGRDLLKLPLDELYRIRGREISFIFQEPMTSFNPVQKIGLQIGEVLEIHEQLPKEEIRERVVAELHRVGIPSPQRQYDAYPHELSGGMRQRAMIAMALIGGPQFIIADEPTTALDVTIQAQILELLQDLKEEKGLSVLLITHNLGIVAETAQRVAVMYAGKIVETASVTDLFDKPLHPYTQGLLDSIPTLTKVKELYSIPGMIPDPLNLPPGCPFEPRCPKAFERCRKEIPVLKGEQGHEVACWLYE